MELHLEDQTPAVDSAEAAPVRRRASRRVSAAAGAAPEVAADTAAKATEAATPAAATAAPAAETVTEQAAPAQAATEAATDAATEAAPEKAAPKRASRSRKKVEPAAAPVSDAATGSEDPQSQSEPAAAEPAAAEAAAESAVEAPKKRATRSRKAAVAEPAPEADAAADTAAEPAEPSAATASETEAQESKAPEAQAKNTRTSGRRSADNGSAESSVGEQAQADDAEAQPARRSRRRANQAAEQSEPETQSSNDDTKRRGRGGNQNAAKSEGAQSDASRNDAATSDASKGDAGRSEAAKSDADSQSDASRQQENGSRSSRTRQRDRKRRGGDDLEFEIAEDDVLLPVAGILDVLDNYAFVRTSGYLPGVSDVYVALGQVKKYSLRRGDALVGAIRQPREGDSGGRQKYNAIVRIDSVNGKPVEETETRPEITEMTPVFPQQRLKLDAGTDRALGRAIDAIAPIGLGQRGLLVLPEQFSGSEVIRELAADISANAPDTHLMVVLTDAQPEVATELSRTISGEVVAATFDRLPEDQTTISELGIDRARRLVELGHDVVVLVDSLNRLARGYAQSQQPAARPSIGAVDEHAIFQVKRLLAAARNVENGGSLTVLATVRAENGNEADTILLREVKGVVNSVIEFDANSTIDAPKLNAHSSRTQHLSAMLDAKELAAVNATRTKQLAAKPAAK